MKARLFSLWLLLSVAVGLSAYDFMVDGLCYNITDENSYTVEVTYAQDIFAEPAYRYLTTVNIPKSVVYRYETYSVTSIGEWAFRNCIGLTSVTIPNSVMSIGGSAFRGCSGLTSITIPNSVTSIGGYGVYQGYAFYGCSGLTSITIPNSITSIGEYAFGCCTGLTSVAIPNSVTYIGANIVRDCKNLTSIVVEAGNASYDSRNNCNAIIDTESNVLLAGCRTTIIPNSVTSIGRNAFEGCTDLTSVAIPSGVTSIGGSAFNGCTGLTSVTIPNSVMDIGGYAFYNCTGLVSITIGNSVTSIDDWAFRGCTSITTIVWNAKNCSYGSSGLTSVPFPNSEQVTSLVFGDSVQYIPVYLCSGMKNLTTITIPNSVTGIGKSAFSGCTGLTSLSIGDGVTSIGESAFSGCSSLTSINIPNSVTSIGDGAFSRSTGLTSITIPDSVTSIESSAFSGCTGLTSVTIPNSVTDIGDSAFKGCTGLISVTIPNGVTSIGESAFSGCTGLTSITIPNSVTSIGNGAFRGTSIASVVWNAKNCNDFSGKDTPFYYYNGNYLYYNFDLRLQITSFIFGDSVQYVPAYLCSGIKNLASITIPNSVTSIGEFAFYDCIGLTSITIPNSVTSIGGYAFSDCTGLASITIGNSVKSIGDHAFDGCTSLTSVVWNAKNYKDFSEKDTPFYYNFDLRPQITSFIFGDSVQYIPAYLCSGMKNLTSITISNSVTSIGKSTFRGCTGLTTVVWNAKNCNDFSGGSTPFYYKGYYSSNDFDLRSQITSFVFGDSVQRIPDYLCEGMENLTSITIGNSVTSIGLNAFYGCTGLTKVNYTGDIKGWLAIDMESSPISYTKSLYINNELLIDLIIPEGITDISSNFANCTSLTSVTIPNSVTDIGSRAFSYCTGLISVVIGNGVTNIGGNAFSGCKNVETVVFGSAVETIGASAFAGCQSIYEMTIYATKVPTIQENTFTEVGTGATLRVPAGCAKKYKAHPYWGVFNIEEIPSEYIITVTCDPKLGQVSGSGTYTDGSEVTITATPNEGYAFTQWSDGNKDNPRKVTVTADATYTAEFALQNYVVTVTCDPQHGQVTGGGTYPYGSEVTLTATPNEGYAFTQWSDGNKDNPRKVTVTADATYTAEFALQNYMVSVTCDPQQGQVTGGGTYPYGSEVTLMATANEGYEFTQWSDGNKDNPRKVTVTADATYTAEFALQNYVVSATCDPQHGQVTGGGTYPYGSEVTLTAVPNDGYTFKQWSDGTLANPYSFPAEKDVNIEALFEPTTPVENVAAEENDAPRKVFRNGQVYILRNGKTYTLTGVEVK